MILSVDCIGQDINPNTKEPFYDKYHPENKIVKKNRIKYVIDSSQFILPSKLNIKLYDTLGRVIADMDAHMDSIKKYFFYRVNGDTTFRLEYKEDGTKLLSFERFIQDQRGQVISYLECRNYNFLQENYYIYYLEFYYDPTNRLQARIEYYKDDFRGKISEKNNIDPTKLQLIDVVYYKYRSMKNGYRFVIGKHAIGGREWRKTDSAIYDNQNRIIRFNSFSKMGTMGETVHQNLNGVTEYKYTDTSLLITDFTTYCRGPFLNQKCLEYSEADKDVTLIIYNPDKTKKTVYGFNRTGGDKYLKHKYEYIHY